MTADIRRGFYPTSRSVIHPGQNRIRPKRPPTAVIHKPLYIFRKAQILCSKNSQTVDKAVTGVSPSPSHVDLILLGASISRKFQWRRVVPSLKSFPGKLPGLVAVFHMFSWLLATGVYTFITLRCILPIFTCLTTKIRLIICL